MKKYFVFAVLLFLIGGMGVQAQNINQYLAPFDDLNAPKEQVTYTYINSAGTIMFDGRFLNPDALQQPIEKIMKRKDPCYFAVITALPKEHEVFQTVVKQHIAAAKAVGKKPFKVYYSTEFPLPPFPPQVEVIEELVVDDVIQKEEGGVLVIEEIPAEEEEEGDDVVYMVVESMPEFPGGTKAMWKFISDNLTYPEEAHQQGNQGRSVVQFVVEKDGLISDVKVVHSAGDNSLDNEAVRIIKMMPQWKPGVQKGKKVRVKFTLPINFKLQNIIPVNGESFTMKYDNEKWSMEPGNTPDAYLFSYKPFQELVSVQFFKGDTKDAKQYIQENVIGKADEYFADATVTDNIGEAKLFGAPVYFTIYLAPWGEQTRKGVAMASNTHGGFLLIISASTNYEKSEFLQLIKTIRFK